MLAGVEHVPDDPRVSASPTYEVLVSSHTPTSSVVELLDQRPELPGVT